MRRMVLLGVSVLLAISTLTCAQKEEAPARAPAAVSGVDLWNTISQDKPYANYGFWPGLEGIMDGQGPHGTLIRTYVNAEALKPGPDAYPYGSIIVKENFMPDSTLAKLTVMYKVKDYNPDGGDWFWAVYGPDGKVEMEGKIQSCIGCHRLGGESDFVLLRALE
jgi:hypothetical protein